MKPYVTDHSQSHTPPSPQFITHLTSVHRQTNHPEYIVRSPPTPCYTSDPQVFHRATFVMFAASNPTFGAIRSFTGCFNGQCERLWPHTIIGTAAPDADFSGRGSSSHWGPSVPCHTAIHTTCTPMVTSTAGSFKRLPSVLNGLLAMYWCDLFMSLYSTYSVMGMCFIYTCKLFTSIMSSLFSWLCKKKKPSVITVITLFYEELESNSLEMRTFLIGGGVLCKNWKGKVYKVDCTRDIARVGSVNRNRWGEEKKERSRVGWNETEKMCEINTEFEAQQSWSDSSVQWP